MKIEQIFQDDINRNINGVVKVDQSTDNVLEQELKEYVITRELKKHFISFFNNYGASFDEQTADIGVWISGFFGSGKSHFLKILSYLLENKEVNGVQTVERFRHKFEDDPATFMLIDHATKVPTDTILFNIDIEGSINKDKTAVLRVFAKMFYNYLGFYGENLKVAKLEQYVEKQGKTAEFRKAFEESNGQPWVDARDAYAFFEDDVVYALMNVLGMSKDAAVNWFNGTETVETSIAQLVSEIKEYVDGKSNDFRLLFMIDEVGQYIGEDTNLLINLQSLVEKIGSECGGKVWVICTGQEAIDEIIKTRENEFSRIQARFKTRLSLSSSSADEVIQKRILKKTPEAAKELETVYNQNDSILRNLFTFTNVVQDIKGYRGSNEFVKDFPFVPYQFIMMQKVFAEIRKHGNSGKHLSGGERSMLSGFQESAQKIKNLDEHALAPFYLFYDTVHTFLESSIRRVIERCERAAQNSNGIEMQDVDILKLLYLIRYVEDIPANIDNIVILMANDIRIDKITMRDSVRESLDRLLQENYIGRVGDVYNFLTDEEQDIAREIRNTAVDTSQIQKRIAERVFSDIYMTKKFRYGIHDFPFDQMVDGSVFGVQTGGMQLQLLTAAMGPIEKNELRLMSESKGQAIIVLEETPYFELLENALKIRKYVRQKNVALLAKSVQDIIRNYQDEAIKYEEDAMVELKTAIENATFYIDGERVEITSGDAKTKMDRALEYLVTHVYNHLELITKNADSDADVLNILNGGENMIPGTEPNIEAAAKIEEYLEMQSRQNLPTSMADIQSRYQAAPYGWREIDIALVMARLIYDQKVTVKYGGMTIQPNNPKLPDMLRKKSETGKTLISKRQAISALKIKKVRDFLKEYFDVMDVPTDEDGLVKFIIDSFTELQAHYAALIEKYNDGKYPGKVVVADSAELVKKILSQSKGNAALIDAVLKNENSLYDNKDDMQNVESFFTTQKILFDSAVKLERDLRNDTDYISRDTDAYNALNRIRLITTVSNDKFNYSRIPELNGLIRTVRTAHDNIITEKRSEIMEIVRQCLEEIHTMGEKSIEAKTASDKADVYYTQKKQQINEIHGVTLLDGLVAQMWQYKDDTLLRMEKLLTPKPEVSTNKAVKTPMKKEIIKAVPRQAIFPARTIKTDEELDIYIEMVKSNMKKMLNSCDGIKIN